MKKIIAIALILVMCLGLVACDADGNNKDNGNKQDVGAIDGGTGFDYTGKWLIIEGEYGADGRIVKVFINALVLAEDGTATYNNTTGTWKYVKSENLVYINGTEIDFPLKTVEVGGYAGLEYVPPMDDAKTFFNGADYYMYTFFKEESDRYASDRELIIGDWYTYDGGTVSFMADGTIQHNTDIELSGWSLTCIGPYSIVDIGHDFPGLFYTKVGSPISLDFYRNSFYSGKHATLITVDNWREYFSENLTDSFEIISKEKKDEWGEPHTEFYITFKDVEKYAYGTNILIEVDNAINPLSFDLEPQRLLFDDYENSKIVRMKGLLVEKP